jgi:hypothetical protein
MQEEVLLLLCIMVFLTFTFKIIFFEFIFLNFFFVFELALNVLIFEFTLKYLYIKKLFNLIVKLILYIAV